MPRGTGRRVGRTIENGHSFCQAPDGCVTHEAALDCGERTFVLGVDVPRVSAAHEQEVRDRILDAAAPRLRREGLPQRDDRGRRPRERPVGRRDLHVLHGQGRAVPADLRPDRRARARRARRRGSLRRRRPPSGWRSPSRSTSRRSTSTTARPARSRLVQAWAEADREPGVREMLAGRRERLVGAGQLLLRQGVDQRRAAGLARRRRRRPAASSRCSTG